jgi:hypothetical protein
VPLYIPRPSIIVQQQAEVVMIEALFTLQAELALSISVLAFRLQKERGQMAKKKQKQILF